MRLSNFPAVYTPDSPLVLVLPRLGTCLGWSGLLFGWHSDSTVSRIFSITSFSIPGFDSIPRSCFFASITWFGSRDSWSPATNGRLVSSSVLLMPRSNSPIRSRSFVSFISGFTALAALCIGNPVPLGAFELEPLPLSLLDFDLLQLLRSGSLQLGVTPLSPPSAESLNSSTDHAIASGSGLPVSAL